MVHSEDVGLATYLNPVYPRSFADPFVLKTSGEYFAYSTGFASDGNVFAVLRSKDLVSWTESGGAMSPLETSPPYYWAPEVTYWSGKFFLYYSAGNEVLMEIRVAVSDRPDSGFVDSGRRLTCESFAIDAHVFADDDGNRFMFYATDFLDHTHVGTGTVVDRMIDQFTLEGDPRPVTRARFDWQVYDPDRKEKGGVRWHTVEGPTVLKRKGVYYQMFSGGNWQNATYGVSFAASALARNHDEWMQFSDGEIVPPILRTIPGVVDGPGHNSVIRGPNNRELYCVYHRWLDLERVLSIDRMDFAGERIFVHGGTSAPQPAPFEPQIKERFSRSEICDQITAIGRWRFGTAGAISDPVERCEMNLKIVPESFLLEAYVAGDGTTVDHGKSGIAFDTHAGRALFSLDAENRSATLTTDDPGSNASPRTAILPADFDFSAAHLIRVECDYRRLTIEIDEPLSTVSVLLTRPVSSVSIFSETRSVAIKSLDVTGGFEEMFEEASPLEKNGWQIETTAPYRIEAGELAFSSTQFALSKGPELHDLEYAVNFRIAAGSSDAGEFAIVMKSSGSETFRLAIDPKTSSLLITGDTREAIPLPKTDDLERYHQLRIIKRGARALCYFDDLFLGEFSIADVAVRSVVSCGSLRVTIEMIRLTVI